MKTRRLALLLLPLALGACMGPYGNWGGSGDPYDDDRGWEDSGLPLSARLYGDGMSLGVSVNGPAHVAIFEVVPGRGMGLLYPAYSHERAYLHAGFNRLFWGTPRYYDWYFTYAHSAYNSDGPRYLFLIASRRPLHIGRFQESPGALRSVLGLNSYASLNAYTAMDQLVEAVVPVQPDDDWTTDIYTIWPDRTGRRVASRITVNCGHGIFVEVPLDLMRYACRSARRQRDTPPPPRDSTEAEGDSVSTPVRRRPTPVASGGEGAGERRTPVRPETGDAADE
ncbi:MAG TPA: hypothetical protein VFX98_02295, partial [Longimicrobiaceae bacterium]|nr:hypothetical protein [Longimicrobiaceae bacterium]